MIVSEIEDLLRMRFGLPDLDPSTLKLIRELARTQVEAPPNNFYWQAAHEDVLLVAGVYAYDVLVDFQLDLFNSFRFIQLSVNGKWRTIQPGTWLATRDGIGVSATGTPERATYENKVLTVSPTPTDDMAATIFYFKQTIEPADITLTDTLYSDYPLLPLYSSLMVGERLLNKNVDAAKIWEGLMREQVASAVKLTVDLLGEPASPLSTAEAARVLQQAGGQ